MANGKRKRSRKQIRAIKAKGKRRAKKFSIWGQQAQQRAEDRKAKHAEIDWAGNTEEQKKPKHGRLLPEF